MPNWLEFKSAQHKQSAQLTVVQHRHVLLYYVTLKLDENSEVIESNFKRKHNKGK